MAGGKIENGFILKGLLFYFAFDPDSARLLGWRSTDLAGRLSGRIMQLVSLVTFFEIIKGNAVGPSGPHQNGERGRD